MASPAEALPIAALIVAQGSPGALHELASSPEFDTYHTWAALAGREINKVTIRKKIENVPLIIVSGSLFIPSSLSQGNSVLQTRRS
jgi:hypothetical protein